MGVTEPFDVKVESRNGILWFAPSGELDMASAPLFSQRLAQSELAGVTAIMLDLRNVTFIDSTGLRALMQAWGRADQNGYELLCVGVTLAVRRVFELTGTEHILDQREAVSTLDQFTGPSRNASPSMGGAPSLDDDLSKGGAVDAIG